MSHAILICDHDPDIRGAMKRTRRGYDVTAFTSPARREAREARDMLNTRTFDATVSDSSLEADRDGLDLLHGIRMLDPDSVRWHFSKPCNDEELRAALEIVLRARPRAAPGGG